MKDKSTLRKEISAAVTQLGLEDKLAAAHALSEKICAALCMTTPGVLALYMPLADEISTLPLAERLSEAGWRVVVPKVRGAEMDFYDYADGRMQKGAWGISEPSVEGSAVGAEEINLMIVPGRAFTSEGVRLGRGKGYYDRYMSKEGFAAHTIGVCFRCQLLPELPSEPHDIRVDEVMAC